MATIVSATTQATSKQKALSGDGLQIVSATLLTVILLAFTVMVAATSDMPEARMEERCAGATFPAEAGCTGNDGVTFTVAVRAK
jgi:hypothetical protein